MRKAFEKEYVLFLQESIKMTFANSHTQSKPFNFLAMQIVASLNLAYQYLFNANLSHRVLTYSVTILYFFFIICFLRYAYVEKHQITQSFLYGNLNFSFVDRSYPEIFGYFLEILCASLLAVYAISHKKYYWLAWTIIFGIAFIDDAFQAHEELGRLLQINYDLTDRIKEPLAFGLLGISFFLFWVTGLLLKPRSGKELQTYMLFSIYFGILVVLGVGVDALHGYLKENYAISETIMTLAEDGGELFMLLICAVTAHGFWCANKDSLYCKS